MSAIEVLPRALVAGSRAVRALALEPVRAVDLGDDVLSAAFGAYVRAWSGSEILDAAERSARALEAAAQGYRAVETALVPRVLR